MKKKILLGAVLVLIAGLALCGCAAMTGIPKGSTLLGVYEGSFSGKFDWAPSRSNCTRPPQEQKSSPALSWRVPNFQPISMAR